MITKLEQPKDRTCTYQRKNEPKAGGRHDMPPSRPATEARSGSLEPGRAGPDQPLRAVQLAGRTCRPDVRDRRQKASSLNAPGRRHNKRDCG